jgi:hypothetical protein
MKVCAKHLLAVKAADKLPNEIRGDELAALRSTKTRFHGMTNDGVNLDDCPLWRRRLELQNSTESDRV